MDAADRGAFRVSYAARHAGTTDRRVHARSAGLEVQFNNCMRRSQEVHPDSAVRVRSDLLRWIMGFSSLTRMWDGSSQIMVGRHQFSKFIDDGVTRIFYVQRY